MCKADRLANCIGKLHKHFAKFSAGFENVASHGWSLPVNTLQLIQDKNGGLSVLACTEATEVTSRSTMLNRFLYCFRNFSRPSTSSPGLLPAMTVVPCIARICSTQAGMMRRSTEAVEAARTRSRSPG